MTLVKKAKHSQKKARLRLEDRQRFGRLLRHPTRKQMHFFDAKSPHCEIVFSTIKQILFSWCSLFPLFPHFNDHFSRWIWVRRYQNVSILDFAKDDGGGGDNWSYRTCKAPVKSSPPTNQHPAFTGRMPFLSPNQQCQSTWREIPSHIYTVW